MSNKVNMMLDVTKAGIQNPLVKLRQGDGNWETLRVTVTANGEPLELQGWAISFMGTTAGQHRIADTNVNIVEAQSGIFEYTPSKAWGMDVGEFKNAYFKFVKGDGSASTASFRVLVDKAVDITDEEAENYIAVFDVMLETATSDLNNKFSSLRTNTDKAMADATTANANASAAVKAANNAVNTMNNSVKTVQVGGRNLLLGTGNSFTGIGDNSVNGTFNAQGGQYYLAGRKNVSDLYKQYGPSQYLTFSFDWAASGSTISGVFNPVWNNTPWGGIAISGGVQPSINNTSGHYKISIPLTSNGYSTGMATGIQFRQDNLQGNITISNLKLEAGNVPTDWSPAPEDATEPFNLLHNTEFENNLSGWNTVNNGGNATISAFSAGSPVNGHQYVRISAGTTALTDNAYFEQVVTGITSAPYTLSFYGWSSVSNKSGAGAWIVEVNSTGVETASNFIDFGESTSWTKYYLTFTPSSTTTSLKIRFKLNRNKSNISVGFSIPQLEPSNAPSAYVRGSDMQVIPDDTNVVHKTGNETIAGDKTFTGNATLATTTILAGNCGLRVTTSGIQKTTDGKTWVSANI